MIERCDLVHGSELFQHALLWHEEGKYSKLDYLAENLDLLHLVIILPNDMKVDISEVDNKQVEVLAIVVLEHLFCELVILVILVITKIALY